VRVCGLRAIASLIRWGISWTLLIAQEWSMPRGERLCIGPFGRERGSGKLIPSSPRGWQRPTAVVIRSYGNDFSSGHSQPMPLVASRRAVA